VAAGMNAMDLRRGINLAVDSVVNQLKGRPRMISSFEEIAQGMEKVGKDGVITVSEGRLCLMNLRWWKA
jgi:chaperonin GroEL